MPTFPQFSKIKNLDKEAYNRFFNMFQPYSDFTYNSLLNWLDLDNNLEYSFLNGNYIFSAKGTFAHLDDTLLVFGNSLADKTLDDIFEFQKNNNRAEIVSMVPEHFIESIKKPEAYDISLDEANSDYVYNVKNIVNLVGSHMRGFRREVNYFLRTYAHDVRTYHLSLEDIKSRISLINQMHSWDRVYEIGNDEHHLEGLSIDKAMLNHSIAPYEAIVLESDQGIDGFAIFQIPPQKNYVILNYLKCNYEKRSVFDFIFYCAASYFKTRGITWLNFEQDLGIEGLKFHKEKLGPAFRLNRYTIKPSKQGLKG